MCYTVGPCWLSTLNIAVCTFPSQALLLSLPPILTCGNHKFGLCESLFILGQLISLIYVFTPYHVLFFFKKEKIHSAWVWKSLIIFAWSVRLYHSVNFENYSSVPYLSKGRVLSPNHCSVGLVSFLVFSPAHVPRGSSIAGALDPRFTKAWTRTPFLLLPAELAPSGFPPHVFSPTNTTHSNTEQIWLKKKPFCPFSLSLSKAIIKAIAVVQLLKCVLVFSSQTEVSPLTSCSDLSWVHSDPWFYGVIWWSCFFQPGWLLLA